MARHDKMTNDETQAFPQAFPVSEPILPPPPDQPSPVDIPPAARTPKPTIVAGEAVRLMLTTLKRVEPGDRAKVLSALAALA